MGSFDFLTVDEIHKVDPELVQRVTRSLRESKKLFEKTIRIKGIDFKFISSVNSTILGKFNHYGKSLGGIRVMDYANLSIEDKEEYARFDATNLGRAMARKWAVLTYMGTQMAESGLIRENELRSFYMGGGKTVIYVKNIQDYFNLSSLDRMNLFKHFGAFLNEDVQGEYMGGEDMNTTVADMDTIKSVSQYTSCFSKELGGSGNPSPVTAEGVFRYMLGLCPLVLGKDSLNGLTIGIQGVGNVGSALAQKICNAFPKANIIFTTLDRSYGKLFAKKIKGTFVEPDKLIGLPMDIFSPNAGSEVLNNQTIPKLAEAGVKLICGAANCQFEVEKGKIKHELAKMCHESGIYVAPDYPANLGGILNLSFEFPIPGNNHSIERAEQIAAGNKDLAVSIFKMSSADGKLPYQCANYLADRVIAAFLDKTGSKEINLHLMKK